MADRSQYKKDWNRRNAEHVSQYNREYRDARPGQPHQDPIKHKEYSKKHFRENKHLWYARAKVSRALESGLLTRKCCEVCSSETTEAHHDDYSKPLEVRWFCRLHHARYHQHKRWEEDASTISEVQERMEDLRNE